MNFYDSVFQAIYHAVHVDIYGINLVRFLSIFFLVFILWVSRVMNSIWVKVFAIAVSLGIYFARDMVDLFL